MTARSSALRHVSTLGLALVTGSFAAAARGQAGPPAGRGLDSLKDDAVMAKLAAYGQESLLTRMFDAANVPPARRAAVRVLGALDELGDKARPLGNTRRQILLRRVADGMDAALPGLTDPDAAMAFAAGLIERGIEPDVNTLEYWGDNPATQALLKPAVRAAVNLLDRAAAGAEGETQKIEKQIAAAGTAGPDAAVADRWMKLDQARSSARYVRQMVGYYLALATDPATDAGRRERKQAADDAIQGLTPYDVEDSGVQPLVHNRLGKLYLLRGEFANARKAFDEVAAGQVKPPAELPQQFEARFFRVLTDVQAAKPDAAAKGLDDLGVWVAGNIPPAQQEAAGAAVLLARYRVASLRTEQEKDVARRRTFDAEAADLLNQLGEKYPAYRPIITDQLVSRLGDNPDVTKQKPAVLQAMLSKGVVERNKLENQPADAKVLRRAIAAAKELAARRDGVTPKQAEDAALLGAVFQDRLGESLAAAGGYLDYAAKYKATNPESAGQAADRAAALAFDLRRQKADGKDVKGLYDRALATAVADPFRRQPLFYAYANWLRQTDRPREAVGFYRAVPKGDPNELNARFAALLLLNSELDDPKLAPAARAAVEKDVAALIDEVRALGRAAPPSDVIKARLAAVTLLGADLAVRQKQPAKALDLLQNFDASVAALPAAADLSREAAKARVNAYLAGNQLDKAVAEVQTLAAAAGAEETATQVRAILERLDKDYDAADRAGRGAETATISATQAALTGYLVKWSAESKDERIKTLAPQYRLYDANTKRKAAGQQPDPARRAAMLGEALAAYEAVRQAGNLDPGSEATVALGIGLSQFDLGRYAESGKALGALIYSNRLGGPAVTETDRVTGETRVRDNATYWEATYKWLKGNAELANAAPPGPAADGLRKGARDTLRGLFVTHGPNTGGEKWAAQYAALRQELLGDTPATAPAR